MSDEPARIWATEDRKNYGEDRFHATSPMTGLTEYVRADLSDALLREAMDVMERTRISMCEGFCRDLPTFATHERSMDNDCAVCHLRPTIAKMKECFPNGI